MLTAFGALVLPQHSVSLKYFSSLCAFINASIYPSWQLLTIYNGYFVLSSLSVASSPGNNTPPIFSRYPFSNSHSSSISAFLTSSFSSGNSFAAISYIGSPIHCTSSSIVIGSLTISLCLSNIIFHASHIGFDEFHNVPSRSNIMLSYLFFKSIFFSILIIISVPALCT